jgi:imidazolonepropionase-like amidohydrolase
MRNKRMANQVLLRNASLLEVEEGVITANQDILIEGEKIKTVGEGIEGDDERSVEIDCSDKFVLPGFFECHAHLAVLTSQPEEDRKEILEECAIEKANLEEELDRQVLQEFVKRGITQIRDCGGPVRVLQAMKDRITKSEYIGPDLFYAGPMLEKSPLTGAGNNERYPEFTVPVDSKQDAAKIVEELSSHGVSLLKAFGKFDDEVLKYLLTKAEEYSLPVTFDPGKTFFHPIPVDKAIDVGIKCIEHGKSSWLTVLKDDLREAHDRLIGEDRSTKEAFMDRLFLMGADSISAAKLHRLAKRMCDERVYLCPTLHVFKHYAEHPEEFNQKEPEKFKKRFETLRQVAGFITGEVAQAGVKLLVGHDGWNPQFTFEEMRLLNETGLSESDIIRGASIYPAQWLGVDHQLGTVSPGKRANLLILNGNPLDDIQNIRATHAVLKGGKIVFREQDQGSPSSRTLS